MHMCTCTVLIVIMLTKNAYLYLCYYALMGCDFNAVAN